MTVAIKPASELASKEDMLVIEFNNLVTTAADNRETKVIVKEGALFDFIYNNSEAICKAGYNLLLERQLIPEDEHSVTIGW